MKNMRVKMVCLKCENCLTVPEKKVGLRFFSDGTAIALMLFFAVMIITSITDSLKGTHASILLFGILLYGLSNHIRKPRCPQCKSSELIPATSPKGSRLWVGSSN